jgi:hypothetical protein
VNADGSKTEIETKSDGSKVETTVDHAAGSTVKVEFDAEGTK